jgi:hypothetical protein
MYLVIYCEDNSSFSLTHTRFWGRGPPLVLARAPTVKVRQMARVSVARSMILIGIFIYMLDYGKCV